MKFEKVIKSIKIIKPKRSFTDNKNLKEALPEPTEAEIKLTSKYSGTDDATKVDWMSAKRKKSKKRKKK